MEYGARFFSGGSQKGQQPQTATGSILSGHVEENLQREFSLAWDEIVWRGNTSSILGYIPNSPAEAEQPNLSLKLVQLGGPFPSKLCAIL